MASTLWEAVSYEEFARLCAERVDELTIRGFDGTPLLPLAALDIDERRRVIAESWEMLTKLKRLDACLKQDERRKRIQRSRAKAKQ